jgi:hypothetical protein
MNLALQVHVFFANERIGEYKCFKGAMENFVDPCGIPHENVHKVGEGIASLPPHYLVISWLHRMNNVFPWRPISLKILLRRFVSLILCLVPFRARTNTPNCQ